jgi:hypothetical protein
VDVLVSQGQAVTEAVRATGVTEVTYYLYGLLPLRKRLTFPRIGGHGLRRYAAAAICFMSIGER